LKLSSRKSQPTSAYLLQRGDDGKLYPVAFYSRRLQSAEENYPVHEKELLAIKEALRVWQCYEENGQQAIVLTDHESLKYMNTIKRPSKRLVRWIEEFQAWDLAIKYRKGSEATVPDALNRRSDYLRLYMMQGLAPHEEYVSNMEEYKKNGILPKNEYDQMIELEAPHFVLMDGRLMRQISKGVYSPYLEWEFREDLIQRMHNEHGHLSLHGMKDLVVRRG
jgi:hypothetical protein